MRAARLLSDRKDRTDQNCRRQHATRELRARAEYHEIERHQRETGGSVRTGVAVGARQRVRTVAEKSDIGAGTAVIPEVPRAIDIGDLFQGTGCRGTDQEPRDQKGRRPSQAGEPHPEPADGECAECSQSGAAHEPAAARVDEADRPPAVRTEPGAGCPVEKQGIRDARVEATGRNYHHCCDQ